MDNLPDWAVSISAVGRRPGLALLTTGPIGRFLHRVLFARGQAVADEPPPRRFWRLVDTVDYWLMQAKLRIVDAVCGPEPPTPADEMREADRERLREASPRGPARGP